MPSSVPFEMQLLVLRGAILLLLYLFVGLVVLVIIGDVRRAGRRPRIRPVNALGSLVLIEPGPTGLEEGKQFPLTAVSSIGRGMRNAVSLDDEFLSAEHALLTWREDTWWLEDLGSTNGTFLNGVRVTRPIPVSPNDVIEVGRVALQMGHH
jgi:hypothetical protein